jgi:ABC-type antimicrobial peptide transport system permease subunit
MMLLAAMSAVALLLCTSGAYGIASRAVATRRREIGVRAALGAAGSALARSVVGRAVRPLVIGMGVGLAVSLGASRLLQSCSTGRHRPIPSASSARRLSCS